MITYEPPEQQEVNVGDHVEGGWGGRSMTTLMYPLGPGDDFPDEFCAIRQGSGEHWFYAPVGEDASWMLFRAESENAKLRELCKRFAEYVSQDRCEGCVYKRRCNDGEIDECWQRTEIREAAYELGIEVEE